jgi:hypothetical protein
MRDAEDNVCHSPTKRKGVSEKEENRKERGKWPKWPPSRISMSICANGGAITMESCGKTETRHHSIYVVDNVVIRVEVQAIVVVVGRRDVVLQIVGQLGLLLAGRLVKG